ncbi:MAG: WYL domain-containing protein [Dehalococcoidales bacterium]
MVSKRTINRVAMTRETKRAVVCTAIKQLRTLEFYYHGGYRTVEPFALGIVLEKRDADNESLVNWQTEGFSDLRETVGWKLYRLSEMEDMEILPQKFAGDRPNYDPDHIEMDRVICSVRLKRIPGEPVKMVEVIKYLPHNEVMARFRYAHPMHLSLLQTAVWPDPLIVRPFIKQIGSNVWTTAPMLENTFDRTVSYYDASVVAPISDSAAHRRR